MPLVVMNIRVDFMELMRVYSEGRDLRRGGEDRYKRDLGKDMLKGN